MNVFIFSVAMETNGEGEGEAAAQMHDDPELVALVGDVPEEALRCPSPPLTFSASPRTDVPRPTPVRAGRSRDGKD